MHRPSFQPHRQGVWQQIAGLSAIFVVLSVAGCAERGQPEAREPDKPPEQSRTAPPHETAEPASPASEPAGAATQSASRSPQPPAAKDSTTASASGSAGASAVTVRVADEQAYRNVIEEHRGNVVLVDFWATWCVPCKEQFPHTVQLSRKYGNQGLTVVSMSLDEPDRTEPILAFLRQQGATFVNLVSAYGGGEKSFEVFDLDGGAVPHYKLYDRSGALAKKFFTDPAAQMQYTPEDIEAAVKDLLAQPATSTGAE
ncbi:MAG: redoxin domain-containing protein [Pirellulales bacterium]